MSASDQQRRVHERRARLANLATRNAADLAAYTSAHQSPDPDTICADYRRAHAVARHALDAARSAASACQLQHSAAGVAMDNARDAIDRTRRAEATAVRKARDQRDRLAELTDPVERAVMEVRLRDAILAIGERATARIAAPAIAIEARRVLSEAWDATSVAWRASAKLNAVAVRAARDVQAARRGRADALAGITPLEHAPDSPPRP